MDVGMNIAWVIRILRMDMSMGMVMNEYKNGICTWR